MTSLVVKPTSTHAFVLMEVLFLILIIIYNLLEQTESSYNKYSLVQENLSSK